MAHTEDPRFENYENYLKRQHKLTPDYLKNKISFEKLMADTIGKEIKVEKQISDKDNSTTLGLYNHYIAHN